MHGFSLVQCMWVKKLVTSFGMLFKIIVCYIYIGIMWKDNESLVMEVLDRSLISYSNIKDVTHLAYLFRVCGGDEVKRMVKVYNWSLKNALQVIFLLCSVFISLHTLVNLCEVF